MKKTTTKIQRDTLRAVHATPAGEWFRARTSGERCTLASLFYRGFLERRAHRGVEGHADAAHEYRMTDQLREAIDRRAS